MSNENKINLPKTYEEAVARKKIVLEKINAYNEELFSGVTPSLSDEEIALLQEEYQILDDIVIEKKIDTEEVTHEEVYTDEGVTVVEREHKKTIFDEINPFVYVYGLIMTLLTSWFVMEYVGSEIIPMFFNLLTDINPDFFNTVSNFVVWLIFFVSFIIYPLLVWGINFVVRLFFRENKANRRAFWNFIIFHITYIIFTFIFLYFSKIEPFYQAIVEAIKNL